jgi:SNF2 family DNA or RNA helicase
MPDFLGHERYFKKEYRHKIEKENNEYAKKSLSTRIKPFILRRTKSEIALDLPQKVEIIQKCELTDEQRDLYEVVRLAMHEKVLAEIDRKGINRSQIIILDALLKLRQVCCDPRLLKSEHAVTESAKLNMLREMVSEMVEEGRKILIFSQFTSMLDLIAVELKKLKISYVELRGDTKDRKKPVEEFQKGETPVFLISLKAGGVGLNLTAADVVIHYDPWWNPAVENQATDRAHRIGQTKSVFVYKLIMKDTLEEKILDLQAKKASIAGAIFDLDNKKSAAQITQDDLNDLFKGAK